MAKKVPATVQHKILPLSLEEVGGESLLKWVELYYQIQVRGSSRNTQLAKQQDLQKFLSFYSNVLGHDQVDGWTPAISKGFQKDLVEHYAVTTVNRVMATLRHFGKWVVGLRPLPAGDPFRGVKDLIMEDPDWNGFTDRQLMRLRSACDHRLHACRRKDQNPLLELTVFYVLLHTGIRESELCSLQLEQYHHRGFHAVKRKGNKISRKVPVPGEAREYLDRYLDEQRPGASGNEPLLVNRGGNRITRSDVYRIIERIGKQANAMLSEEERFKVSPHMLRHTFLKRVADKHDIHVAQEMSGNVSMKEIFRYTRPSQEEMEQTAEGLF